MSKSYKTELRKEFKNIRNNINPYVRHEKSELIRQALYELLSEYKTIFVYKSYLSEVDTEGIIKDLFLSNKKVLIPKCDLKSETMSAVEILPENSFKLNDYGILESDTDYIYSEKIDAIILPGLVFDKKGNRIGYGKGYYDKFINSLKYRPVLIGICFYEQLIGEISDCNEYDVKLDYVVTDSKILKLICE